MTWSIGGETLTNRLFLGTALYPSPDIMRKAIIASEVEVITVALKRELEGNAQNPFWAYLKTLPCLLLPNTAGCHTAREALTTAEMAREIFNTHWIKLEVTGDDYTLQPDPFQLLEAAKLCIQSGFTVFAYCTEDLVLCEKLLHAGCDILMPWGAPIGTGLGLVNPYGLKTLRSRLPEATLLVDAGIGAPSQAAKVMEMGFDGVLLNSAVALANCPVTMAQAFSSAVKAGRQGYEGGLMPPREMAKPSTCVMETPFWHQEMDSPEQPS